MTERNIKLTIAYDGSGYHGWQVQPGLATLQDTLQTVIARIVNHPVNLVGSGRTDARVHAAGQVANFRTTSPIPTPRLPHAINSRLPNAIRVLRAHDVPDNFDAISSAQSKLYRYTLFNHSDLPCSAETICHHFYVPCELAPMRQAAGYLLGEHDFTSFASPGGKPRASNVRTLTRCDVNRKFHWITFDCQSNGFLYHMVRNIVGTLIEVGRGRWRPEKVLDILAARSRAAAGPMAPPNGLSLQWVRYPSIFDPNET